MIFKILCSKGDSPYDYDTDVAEIKFDELKSSGMLPMKCENGVNTPMEVFDGTAEVVVWVPKIAGG